MVRALLGLTETPGADAADALAIGLTHLRAQEAVRLGIADPACGYERRHCRSRWLGRIGFAEALALAGRTGRGKAADHSLGDELCLLEHEPVYTIGRTPDQSSLRGAAHLPHPLFPINRGGQATYHGPGQLIGYPIIDLRRCGQDLHRYLRWIEALADRIAGRIRNRRHDARRPDRCLGRKIARSRRSASACGIGSRCTDSR